MKRERESPAGIRSATVAPHVLQNFIDSRYPGRLLTGAL